MSFPKYPKYKDSGVEWLGQIPEHWVVAPYKRMVDIQNGSDHKHIQQDEGYPVIGSGGVFAYASEFMYDGESVLLGRKGTIDKPLHVNGRFWTVDTMYWTKISPEACGRFAYYAALTIPFDFYSTNTALPSMTKGALSAHVLPAPPLPEQTAIASFLDAETSKIDALIAEQRRLIELLKEKRQAVISHAVTKGLNPDAPMKPSGIEWLGDVPEHWEVKTVRHACQIDNTLRFPIDKQTRSDLEGEYRYYGPTGILSWINEYRVDGEYFLLGEDGDHFLKFETQAMTILVDGKFNVNNHAHLVRGVGECSTAWACRYFEHKDLLPWLIKQGVGRYKLRKETLQTIPIAVPPKNEQNEVLRRIHEVSSATAMLTTEATHAIDLLQERRTALISAAVTGKIDVREFSNVEAA